MGSQSTKFTVVCFYLSWRGVISLSSQYWNLVLRLGQSFPAIITSIWYTNTCVPAIKCSKTLQTPRAPFWLDSRALLMSHLHSVCWESVLQLAAALWAGVVWLGVVSSLRLQCQIECRTLPGALKTVVMRSVMRASQAAAHSNVFSFNSFYLFELQQPIYKYILIVKMLLLEQKKKEGSPCMCFPSSVSCTKWDIFQGVEIHSL